MNESSRMQGIASIGKTLVLNGNLFFGENSHKYWG